jgi:hypothetical protein
MSAVILASSGSDLLGQYTAYSGEPATFLLSTS